MKYEEPKMEVVMLPTAAVFTLTSAGNGDDIVNDGNGARGRGSWL